MKLEWILLAASVVPTAIPESTSYENSQTLAKRRIRRSFEHEIKEATTTLMEHTFIRLNNKEPEAKKLGEKMSTIPGDNFKRCLGVAIVTTMRVSPDGPALEIGTGLVMRRLDSGKWSAPSSFSNQY